MPIYKMDGKKDGLQKYRVRVNYTDREGESRQLDRVAYGKEEAKELERQLHRDLTKETTSKMTVQQLYDEYINVKKYEIRETSLFKSKKRLELYVLPKFKSCRIDKLNLSLLQNWKNYINEKESEKGVGKLSLSTKQGIFADFRAILNYAVKMEYIPKNPLTSVGNFRDAYEKKTNIDFYTAEEFVKFSNAAEQEAIKSYQNTGSILNRTNLYGQYKKALW